MMEHFELVSQCTCGDDVVYARSNREACSPCRSIEIDRLKIHIGRHRRLDDRHREHRLACPDEGRFGIESLQHFLDYRQTGDDLIEIDKRLELYARRRPEDLDPHRRVNEHHGVAVDTPLCLPA